jgi:hypothetical protein
MHATLNRRILAICFVLAERNCIAGENVAVKILDRQNHQSVYTYVVLGSSMSDSKTVLNCSGADSSIQCSGTTQTTSVNTPASSRSYEVNGATFSLQLPDGRIAIVNCGSKAPPTGVAVAVALAGGGAMNRRSCRIPLVNDIQAEFSGDKAKLKWPVSIDGKKSDSETYKILAVINKP